MENLRKLLCESEFLPGARREPSTCKVTGDSFEASSFGMDAEGGAYDPKCSFTVDAETESDSRPVKS
jgi:hypothetical protein